MARSRPNRGNAAAPKQPTTTTTTTTTSTTEQQQQQPSKDDLRAAANLVSLRRTDPAVTAIVDSTSQVALYRYSSTSKGWAKEGAEGAMFLVRRDPTTQSHITNKPIGGPRFALAILNRVATHNWTLPLTRDLAFAPNGDYWMFQSKRDTATSFGIWFFEMNDRERFHAFVVDACKNETVSASSPTTAPAAQPAAARPADASASPSFLASAQNDLMGMLTRARANSDAAAHHQTGGAPDATTSDPDDLARIMSKLGTATTAAAPSSSSATSARRRPASPSPPPLASASTTQPMSPPASTGTAAPPIDPGLLARATVPALGALPPGLPTRDVVRDAVAARLATDPMFVDFIYSGYIAQMQMAAMAVAAGGFGPGGGFGAPGGGGGFGPGGGMMPPRSMMGGMPPGGMPPGGARPPPFMAMGPPQSPGGGMMPPLGMRPPMMMPPQPLPPPPGTGTGVSFP